MSDACAVSHAIAFARDRLRQEVLERLQWNIYRIWSTDWFHNADEESQKLLGHIDKLPREEG